VVRTQKRTISVPVHHLSAPIQRCTIERSLDVLALMKIKDAELWQAREVQQWTATARPNPSESGFPKPAG
jgi:hypothetical protein